MTFKSSSVGSARSTSPICLGNFAPLQSCARQFEYKGNRLPEEVSEFSGTAGCLATVFLEDRGKLNSRQDRGYGDSMMP